MNRIFKTHADEVCLLPGARSAPRSILGRDAPESTKHVSQRPQHTVVADVARITSRFVLVVQTFGFFDAPRFLLVVQTSTSLGEQTKLVWPRAKNRMRSFGSPPVQTISISLSKKSAEGARGYKGPSVTGGPRHYYYFTCFMTDAERFRFNSPGNTSYTTCKTN